jgi:predicted HTH transcriptional regulator
LRRANENYRPTVRHLHALSRFDETPQRTVIDLQGMSYVMLGDEDSATSEVAQTKVWSALSGPDNPLTTAELQEQVTIRRADMFAAINALLAAGRIRRIGRGKVGDAYRYFRVSEDAAVDDDDYEQDELP